MKKIIAFLTVIVVAVSLSGSLKAQPALPPDPNDQGNYSTTGNNPLSGPATAPIGGGAGILVAFGIAYAINKYNSKKKVSE